MTSRRWIAGAAIVLIGCAEREPAGVAGPAFVRASPGESAPRFLVTLAGAETSEFDAAVHSLGGQVERRHPEIATVTVRGVRAADAPVLSGRADVANVDGDLTLQWIPQPEHVFRRFEPGDVSAVALEGTDQGGAELIRFQWNMRVVDAAAAWHATPGGRGRLICILDTGVDTDHVELAGRVDFGRSASFVEGEPTIEDFNSHGTFVASIASSNGIRLASVAPDSRVCAVKVLGTNGRGSFADLISGILFAVNQGADVINLSLGAYVDLREQGMRSLVQALQRTVKFANRQGVVVVAAAGNDTINLDTDSRWKLMIPAQLDGVISVGATAPLFQQDFDRLAGYSNVGGETGVALVAPGGDLPNGSNGLDLVLGACSHTQVTLPWPCQTSYVVSGKGTSFASPHVAGAAAVVGSTFVSLAPGRIARCILDGADPVSPPATFGAGRLNVARAAACPALDPLALTPQSAVP